MKLKEILGGCGVALGLLTYSNIDSSYANDMNNAPALAASSQVPYSERLVLTQGEYEERKRSLESLRDAFVKTDEKDPRPSANIEDLAIELVGNPHIKSSLDNEGFVKKYSYGLMTPSERYVVFPRHAFVIIELYIRKALEGDRFSTDNSSKRIAVYNLDKSHEATFNFLRDNINVRDNEGNLYPLNPYLYCSVPSLDVAVTKAESSEKPSPFKIHVKGVGVGDRLNFFNIGGRGDEYLSQATVTVTGHLKSARLIYSEEYSLMLFDAFRMDTIGRKGLSGSILSENNGLFGMVSGTRKHKLVATSARNIAKAVRWCAEKGLKKLDSITIVN